MALLMGNPKHVPKYAIDKAVEELMCNILLDQNQPISERFRALSLREIDGSASRDAFIKALNDPSSLLAYNAAYELGRMQDFDSFSALKDALNNRRLHPIVRHKAAESLGSFPDDKVVQILKHSLELDPAQEVQETCELALTHQDKIFRPFSYTSIVPPPSVPKLRKFYWKKAIRFMNTMLHFLRLES